MRRPGRTRLVLGESDRQSMTIPAGQDCFQHQTVIGSSLIMAPAPAPVATCTSYRPAPRCSCSMFNLAWEEEPR